MCFHTSQQAQKMRKKTYSGTQFGQSLTKKAAPEAGGTTAVHVHLQSTKKREACVVIPNTADLQ